LLFAQCRTCSENQQQKPCQHSDEERSLTGTWVRDELKKALEKGYVVQRIYEVWYFDPAAQNTKNVNKKKR
jgi:ATP sulfurylase